MTNHECFLRNWRLVSLARVISKIFPGVSARPTCVSMRVASADMHASVLRRGGFHGDRSGKEDVVFQMNMLMEVGFKGCQGFVQSLEADASIARGRIARAGFAHCAQRVAGGVVLLHHH